jgi:hypothetical protein
MTDLPTLGLPARTIFLRVVALPEVPWLPPLLDWKRPLGLSLRELAGACIKAGVSLSRTVIEKVYQFFPANKVGIEQSLMRLYALCGNFEPVPLRLRAELPHCWAFDRLRPGTDKSE